MKRNLFALAVGLIFGLGLCISGMYQPGKVIGFLDLAGAWDPSLAFVMIGAIAVALPAFWIAKRRSQSWLGGAIEVPSVQRVDAPLLAGSAIFGVGWGLAGVCPAPGIVDLGFLNGDAAIFVAAMAAGVLIYRAAAHWRLPDAGVLTQDA
jgi:uncharacterized protein